MKNKTKILLIMVLFSAAIGVFTKLTGSTLTGDIFLAISTVVWLFLVYTLIFQFINRKQYL